jgi:hypothetical protein
MHCKPCGRGNVYFDKRLALFNFSGGGIFEFVSNFAANVVLKNKS